MQHKLGSGPGNALTVRHVIKRALQFRMIIDIGADLFE
jgi:hypothetical protein